MKAAISATYVAFSLTVLLLSWDNYKSALGQAQQQFQNYQNPTLGFSIQYPSDWELQEESNDKLRFIKQEGFVTADLNVESLDESETTLSEYANTRVNELQGERPEFQLISNEPTTISNKPAQKVIYTFEREEDGKTNKVMRIWTINEDKLYTLAYIAESTQYDRYLPAFQRMVDSFRLVIAILVVAPHKFKVVMEVERIIMEAETVTAFHIQIQIYAYHHIRLT